jgi:hypothetical protein
LDSEGALVQPIEYLHVPSDCENKSEDEDHVMIRYSLRKAATPNAAPIFSMMSWEQQHFQLGHSDTPAAFTLGLMQMCPGERRRLTFSASEFDLTKTEALSSPVVSAEVELLTLTPSGDFYIFELIEKQDVSSIMEMVDNHVGVNAVDKYGNSALMAAVQSGSNKMQMVVASLINSWRPKVDVDYSKPSGHSVLFYAVTQDDSEGTTILKALLRLGADPNTSLVIPASAGWTPLHFACKFRNLKHAALLLEYGADPLAKTADGKTVLDVASDAPHSIRKKIANMLNEALERMETNPALGHSEL